MELPIKVMQDHASIVMTSDGYGHLFPRQDDGNELAEAEVALMKAQPSGPRAICPMLRSMTRVHAPAPLGLVTAQWR